MRERPILFSGPMVRAIFAGKTQTRRIIKNADWYACLSGDCPHDTQSECDQGMVMDCPYGQPGGRLWVRETWRETIDVDQRDVMEYRAGGTRLIVGVNGHRSIAHGEHRATSILPKWRPSIFMPRWACRLTLELTAVRVERVQSMTPEDAVAEGRSLIPGDPRGYFPETWNTVNGPGAWERNDWVWALTFRRSEAAHA